MDAHCQIEGTGHKKNKKKWVGGGGGAELQMFQNWCGTNSNIWSTQYCSTCSYTLSWCWRSWCSHAIWNWKKTKTKQTKTPKNWSSTWWGCVTKTVRGHGPSNAPCVWPSSCRSSQQTSSLGSWQSRDNLTWPSSFHHHHHQSWVKRACSNLLHLLHSIQRGGCYANGFSSPALPPSCNSCARTLSGGNTITPKHWSQGQGFVYLLSSVVQLFVTHLQGNWSTVAGKSPQWTGEECTSRIFKYHLQLRPNNSSLSVSPDCNMQQ